MSDRQTDMEAMNRILALAEMRVIGFEGLEERQLRALSKYREILYDPFLDDKHKVIKMKAILDTAEGRVRIFGKFGP